MQSEIQNPQILTDYKGASKLLSIKESRLRLAVSRNEIPFIKIGHLVRFNVQELINWARSNK